MPRLLNWLAGTPRVQNGTEKQGVNGRAARPFTLGLLFTLVEYDTKHFRGIEVARNGDALASHNEPAFARLLASSPQPTLRGLRKSKCSEESS
jgi:hypothetical protein